MIFILAAGQQARWEGDGFKQLLPIGETTVLERTIEQLCSRGLQWCLVICKMRYFGSRQGGAIAHRIKKETRYTSETLLNISNLWQRKNTILLGDVIYSHKTLDRILNCQEPIKWFGNLWEIFAISFDDTVALKVMLKLGQTIEQAEEGQHTGKLRNFYHTYCDLSLEGDDIYHPLFGIVDSINDYTNDIDTLEEYENFLKQHLVTMIHDDNNCKANN